MSVRKRMRERAKVALGLIPASQSVHTETVAMAPDRVTELLAIESAAISMIEMLDLIGADGKPAFSISDQLDDESAELIRVAIFNLFGALNGTDLPALATPKVIH